jgi:hypothetical protein
MSCFGFHTAYLLVTTSYTYLFLVRVIKSQSMITFGLFRLPAYELVKVSDTLTNYAITLLMNSNSVDEVIIKVMYQNLDEVKGQADLKGFYSGTIQVSNPLVGDHLYTQNVAYNRSLSLPIITCQLSSAPYKTSQKADPKSGHV